MSSIQAVYFDLGHTLLHPYPVGRVYAEVGRKYGSRQVEDVLRDRFLQAFKRQEEVDRTRGWRTDETRELERWRTIVAEALDDVTDFEACFRELYAFYAKPEGWRLDEDATAVLAALTARHIRIGIASNLDHRIYELAPALPELAAIDSIVVSAAVGYRKPAPAFYEAVVRAAGCPAANVLMVGDDRAADYEGARACGLQAALVGKEGMTLGEIVGLVTL